MDMHARVVEAAGRLRQILAADLDDQLVDLDEVDALRRLIARQLAHDAAVTRADDEDILGIRVDGHGDVRDHLMIDELVLLRQHHIAVKRQEAAEFPRLEHVDPLKFALRRIELALDLDGKIHIRRMPPVNQSSIVSLLCQHVQVFGVQVLRAGQVAALGLGIGDIVQYVARDALARRKDGDAGRIAHDELAADAALALLQRQTDLPAVERVLRGKARPAAECIPVSAYRLYRRA